MRAPITKYAAARWLNKCVVPVAATLLIGLALTPFARYAMLERHTVANYGEAKGGVMGRGGQFDRVPLW
jgi:hypothetical protein